MCQLGPESLSPAAQDGCQKCRAARGAQQRGRRTRVRSPVRPLAVAARPPPTTYIVGPPSATPPSASVPHRPPSQIAESSFAMSRTLLATAEPLLPASAVSGAGDAAAVDVLTGQAALDALLASGAKFSSAVVAPGAGRASLAPDFLGGIAKALNPGGRVTVQLVAGGVVAVSRRGARPRDAHPLLPAHGCRRCLPQSPGRRRLTHALFATVCSHRRTSAARCCSAASSTPPPRLQP